MFHQGCRAACTSVLSIEKNNTKALARRALASEGLGNYVSSLEDIESALANCSTSQINLLLDIRNRVRHAVLLDKNVQKLDQRPEMFVTKHQTLRLNFADEMPKVMRVNSDVPYIVRMYVGNEFGLWDRNNINAGTEHTAHNSTSQMHVEVQCNVEYVLSDNELGPDLTYDSNVSPLSHVNYTVSKAHGASYVRYNGRVGDIKYYL
jgi:hypothetical protein